MTISEGVKCPFDGSSTYIKEFDFPDLTKCKKLENPLEYFYESLQLPKGTKVTQIVISQEDFNTLEKRFYTFVKADLGKTYSKEKIDMIADFNWLNMCPESSVEITKGRGVFNCHE